MKKRKGIFGNMAGRAVEIDIDEPSSAVTYLSPDGEMADSFSFNLDDNGYNEFRKRIPTDARIAFEATGLAYGVNRRLASLGYCDITVTHRPVLEGAGMDADRSCRRRSISFSDPPVRRSMISRPLLESVPSPTARSPSCFV